ncbi:Ankyrin repeat-containing domain protein [Fusarium austroafricanum]|uniref:Ankyrin repeat-containing domain protein n=1 Tax=Fusarium austroafricanum TaxID=2364996 RepID=A0A8H4JXB4_9HYPO|nr:Ankyrin repeat-containing domain protein [Fusarium austroafricanum]
MHQNGKIGLQYEEISNTLRSRLGDYSRAMFVVDALDEDCQINLFTTSRRIPAIEAKFQDYPSLHITASQDDIYQYIQTYKWPLSSLVPGNLKLQQEIESCISQAAQGMFLLAKLYLRSLEDKTTSNELKQALDVFQKRAQNKDNDQSFDIVGQAYDEVIDRINHQSENYKCKAYQVMSSVRENEFDVNEGDLSSIELLLSVCCGVVTLGKATQTVQLVHYTAQDYFLNTQQRWFPDAHSYLAKQCISYLSLHMFEEGLPVSAPPTEMDGMDLTLITTWTMYQFLPPLETIVNWGHHVRNAATSVSEVDQATVKFLRSESKVVAAMNIRILTCGPNLFPKAALVRLFSGNGLHLAAFCGLDRVIPSLRTIFEIDSKDSQGRTALSWASEAGGATTVELLVSLNADINATDRRGCTSLFKATESNHVDVLKILINAGADVNAVTRDGVTALHHAAKSNYNNIAQLLLSEGARFDISNNSGKIPLNIAVQNGSQLVYETLCKMGADPRSSGSNRRTVLKEAAWVNNEALVKTLVQQKVGLDDEDHRGRTALMEASEKGNDSIVEVLLQHGAKVDIQDWKNQTALIKASKKGHQRTVELLLENGADQKAIDDFRRPSLIYASLAGHYDIVKFLLENGADQGVLDRFGSTTLAYAIRREHRETFRILLEHGFSIDNEESHARSALMEASVRGCLGIVSELLDSCPLPRGSSLAPRDYGVALLRACENGHDKVVRLLLENGALTLTTRDYKVALLRAYQNGFDEGVLLMLKSVVDFEHCDEETLKKLILEASKRGDAEMVQELIRRGVDVNAIDEHTTPIMLASGGDTNLLKTCFAQQAQHSLVTGRRSHKHFVRIEINN